MANKRPYESNGSYNKHHNQAGKRRRTHGGRRTYNQNRGHSKGSMLAKYVKTAYSFGNSEEDIQRWREQRKNNFPTSEKIKEAKNTDHSHTFSVPEKASNGRSKVEIQMQLPRVCIKFLNGKCPFGESCKFSHDAEAKIRILMKRKDNIRRNKQIHQDNMDKITNMSAFEKLLQDEIEKESFIKLEIVKFLVENHIIDSNKVS